MKSCYGVPIFSSLRPEILTFNTKDEEEALKLASCIYGKEAADHFLVAINEEGEIY